MAHNYLHKIGQSIFPGGNPFYQEDEDTAHLRRRAFDSRQLKTPEGDAEAALLEAEIEAQETHDMQEYMNIAATAGASGGGAPVSQGGPKKPYGDTAMFNPKAMPEKYIPGTRPREEEELIPPGLFSPYRMYR